jgi:hypothetical protein
MGKRKQQKKQQKRLARQLKQTQRNSAEKLSGRKYGMYETYKRYTSQFTTYLKSVVPSSIKCKTVAELIPACRAVAKRIAENKGQKVPQGQLFALNRAIELRGVYSGFTDPAYKDQGHEYFIKVLKCCREILWLHREQKTKTPKMVVAREESAGAGFDKLSLSDENSDDEEDGVCGAEDGSKTSEISIPEKLANVEFDIQRDLIEGDDHFQATLFLAEVGQLMGVISTVWRANMSQSVDTIGFPNAYSNLIECTVATNEAVETVRRLEAGLSISHPHLNTFCRVLVAVLLPNIVDECMKMIKTHNGGRNTVLGKEIVMFIGDLLECGLHNISSPKSSDRHLVYQFQKKSKVPQAEVIQFAELVKNIIRMECMLEKEQKQNPMAAVFMQAGTKTHNFLTRFDIDNSICGENCLMNTHGMLQKIQDVINPKAKLLCRPDWFGDLWDERSGRHQITGAMDQLLAARILPDLIVSSLHNEMFRVEFAGDEGVSFFERLMPLRALLKDYVEIKDTPIPLSLSFGVHALLTSVRECQGNVARIMNKSIAAYGTLFNQLEAAKNTTTFNQPLFKTNLEMSLQLKKLPIPIPPNIDKQAFAWAYWNPYIGGQFLAIGSIACNLNLGCSLIDNVCQLRMTLHLYNGMLLLKKIGRISLLDILMKYFSKSRFLFPSGKPNESGELMKAFLVAYGSPPKAASTFANEIKKELSTGKSGLDKTLDELDKLRAKTRSLDPIKMKEISDSFTKVCLGQINTDEEVYNKANESVEGDNSALETIRRINMAMDSIENDFDLLRLNLTALGVVLNEYLCLLLEHLGDSVELSKKAAASTTAERSIRRMNNRAIKPSSWMASKEHYMWQMVIQKVISYLAAMDVEGDGLGISFGSTEKIAQFTTSFFSKLDKSRYEFM